jgi:hypothetical protein
MGKEALGFALLFVILMGIFAHSFLPRYEWHEVREPNAISIIVYDKWTGRMQRAVYNDAGGLNVMGVYSPF